VATTEASLRVGSKYTREWTRPLHPWSRKYPRVALDIYDIVKFCADTIHVEFERTLAVATIRGMFVRIFPGLRS
jgi:hypothetical protein